MGVRGLCRTEVIMFQEGVGGKATERREGTLSSHVSVPLGSRPGSVAEQSCPVGTSPRGRWRRSPCCFLFQSQRNSFSATQKRSSSGI